MTDGMELISSTLLFEQERMKSLYRTMRSKEVNNIHSDQYQSYHHVIMIYLSSRRLHTSILVQTFVHSETHSEIYRTLIKLCQAQVGGGEGVEGIYGSIGMSGMLRIFSVLVSKCGLGSSSVFLDVGTGLGRCCF